MKKLIPFIAGILMLAGLHAQVPVPMASQPSLTYTENFSDIASWTNNFVSGSGANRFTSVAPGGATAIPSATRITANTNVFQVGIPPAPPVSSTGGVHRGTDQTIPTTSIILLSTATADNTTSSAIDFYMDFTGVDAGTLSFDWATVFNSTGNRNGSLRVYASIDGLSYTEIASVLNFTNNVTASGSITNVAMPTSFNNSATARLRFYYHNGTGGTTGSRPKLSIDNLKVTAVPNTPCVTPPAQPTNLILSNITSSSINGNFTAASPAANSYLIVVSNNNSLTSLPLDGTTYNLGDNVGDGFVISNNNALSFTATGLSASTTYYFYVFSENNICVGPVKYLTANPLLANAATPAGLPACTTPAAQPTALTFGTATVNTILGSFTAAAATDGYLVLKSTAASLTNNPVNGVSYAPGNILGNATVVQQNNLTSFTSTGLSPITLYYFYIFSYNNLSCSSGPAYNVTAPLNGSMSTANLAPCAIPTAQPTRLSFTASGNAIAGSFNAGSGSGDAYLVIRSLSPTLSATPINNTDYNLGDGIGGGIVISNNSEKSFLTQNLTASTTYYFYVFAFNKLCSGGTKYLTVNPLEGNAATSNNSANNYYFGNLHAHSDYSDGNQDNPGYTPADDYNYAMSSQCMDYLGISEHNHFTSNNNPGNRLSTYGLGITQATNFTIAHPSFIALYGMEWGVISNGGHVLVYGDGMNNLWGWETGAGVWGGSSNYNEFIAKSDYTSANGLFQTVNNNSATNTFASLAHPNDNDYGNLANIGYSATFDAAISATAVESGPSTSTNTTYSNPGSSMSYLWYYQKLLAKGYHLAPTIDHDNHNTTFGRTTYSRSAVVAPVLSKTNIINGFRNMHVYATQDCDTKVDFTVNTKIMGSSLVAAGAPVISVNLTDVSNSTAGALIKVMFGLPGSNINAAEIYSTTGSSLLYVDDNLANLATGYYYIDVTNGSSRMVTAPAWYTRSDLGPLPVNLGFFTAQKQDKTVKLNWSTEQEINSSHFIIERSADGRTWQSVGSIAAAGYSSNHLEYIAYDNLPLNGTSYYRIKQVDKDGKLQVSVVKPVRFDLGYIITVAPNPAKDFITVTMDKISNSTSTIQFFNAAGNLVFTQQTNLSKININTAVFARGLYFIKIINAGEVATQKVLLQ